MPAGMQCYKTHFVNVAFNEQACTIFCGLCSTAGHKIAKLHFYSATKYAVGAVTEGIRQELREMKSNVRISVSWISD